jgi:dihydroflavonol-4-reductase
MCRPPRILLEAAYAQGVRRLVHVSSIAVLDGPRDALINESMNRREMDADDYYLSKILAEREVNRFLESHPDFWAAFVLPGWMHGPGDAGPTSAGQTVLDFLHARLPGIPPGMVSLVDARDVAAAAVAVSSRGRRGERYLAAGRSLAMTELMSLMERVSGVSAPKRQLPLSLLRAMAFGSEIGSKLTGKPVLLSRATVKLMGRESGRTRFDPAKSRTELGLYFRPLEETLRDEIAWYCRNGWLHEAATGTGSEHCA